MKNDTQIKKYLKQLVVEGILQSALFGLSIGFFVGCIIFLLGTIVTQDLLWLGIGLSFRISLISSIGLYYYVFKPTKKETADRVDEFGFEERVLTMVELEDSESYIAQVQREDTKEILKNHTLKLLTFKVFIKPLIIFSVITLFMFTSMRFMIVTVNAASEIIDPTTTEELTDDEIFQQMIDEILSIISNANIDVELKSTLYGMVVELERRIPTYETYAEKYTDVLVTRNAILQLIEDAILDEEEKLMNIAEALQKYDNTEALGIALATWNDDEIIAAFDYMYDRIDDLLGQELYDVMNQTADDIEAALAEAVGTYPAMQDALQSLADAYRIAIEDFQAGQEAQVLDEFLEDMDESLNALLQAVQELRDIVEELLELEEEIEEEIDQIDEFPMFMPYPEDSDEGDEPDNPDTTSQNMVIDGETPYEDVYDEYYLDAMDWLTSEDISEDIRQIIENYFDMLE